MTQALSKTLAFTLTELLIALVILGLVTTFTLPKVIANIDQTQNEAKLKEAIALIEQIGNEAYMEGQYNEIRWDYFIAKINPIKICGTNSTTQDCTAASLSGDGTTNERSQPGFVLANGTVIAGINRVSLQSLFSGVDNWMIDVNGAAEPNTYGQDVLHITAPRFTATGGKNSNCSNRRLLCPNSGSASSVVLYNNLFR
jgi:prepilin-type N-terminal cleavage/methylation domain-containing protein